MAGAAPPSVACAAPAAWPNPTHSLLCAGCSLLCPSVLTACSAGLPIACCAVLPRAAVLWPASSSTSLTTWTASCSTTAWRRPCWTASGSRWAGVGRWGVVGCGGAGVAGRTACAGGAGWRRAGVWVWKQLLLDGGWRFERQHGSCCWMVAGDASGSMQLMVAGELSGKIVLHPTCPLLPAERCRLLPPRRSWWSLRRRTCRSTRAPRYSGCSERLAWCTLQPACSAVCWPLFVQGQATLYAPPLCTRLLFSSSRYFVAVACHPLSFPALLLPRPLTLL